MKRFSVELLPAAEADFRRAFLWYFERSPLAADAFRTEVFDSIDGLESRADMWPQDHDGIRKSTLRHFPYTIFYEVLNSTAIVFAIAHQRRRPGFWKDR